MFINTNSKDNSCQNLYSNKIIRNYRIWTITNFMTQVGSLLKNQNYIQEEIKCRLKAGNSCYYSVQKFLSSRLLSENLKIKIYKTIILPVVLYGCETWSLTLREECRILRQISGSKRDEDGEWRRLHIEKLHSCTVYLTQSE